MFPFSLRRALAVKQSGAALDDSFDDSSVVKCAYQHSAAREFLKQSLVVDIETQRPGRCIQIGAIDKQPNSFRFCVAHQKSTFFPSLTEKQEPIDP
jgi:hypothetical protein